MSDHKCDNCSGTGRHELGVDGKCFCCNGTGFDTDNIGEYEPLICPYCGEENEPASDYEGDYDKTKTYTECESCGKEFMYMTHRYVSTDFSTHKL